MFAPVSIRTLYFAPGLAHTLPRECRTLNISDLLRELILHKAPERDLQNAARKEGMTSLREHGLAKAAAGLTTLEEVFRTTIGDALEE